MTTTPWPGQFETMLRSYLPLLRPDKLLDAELSLTDHGLDSLATVSLLLDLEDAFGVTVPDDRLTMTTFATPQELWNVIDELLMTGSAS
ncbi:phosphopantetheine-binding protein [Nonomuraea sp. NPDC050227]|uniref:phosphopantetheine-binding protein n=1 Tax=Nonomuraea sp. NPDC050227 TaxID=3364360 RepID=UPI00379BEC76